MADENEVDIDVSDAILSMDPNAVAYETETMLDLVSMGWIPLWVCPYTTHFGHITGTRCLVDNPDNIPDCGGDEANGGCVHLKPIIAGRQAAFLKAYQDELEQHNRMTKAQASDLLQRMAQAIDVAAATRDDDNPDAPPRPTAARRRARED